MWIGVLFGLLATSLWGASYLIPLMLPEYDLMYITFARGVMMGLTSLVIILVSPRAYRALSKEDWIYAFKISIVGQLLQAGFVFASVVYSGVAIAGMCFGCVPVLVALISNYRDKKRGKTYVPYSKLWIALAAILLGFFISNVTELENSLMEEGRTGGQFFFGLLCGLTSTAMWTWYPIKNADWLQEHPQTSSTTWITAQCLILLPVSSFVYAFYFYWDGSLGSWMGPAPWRYLFYMFLASVICAFVAGLFWNICSFRCPTALVGQLLVFETIFSVVFGQIYKAEWPSTSLVCGFLLLIFGVSYSLRLFNEANRRNEKYGE